MVASSSSMLQLLSQLANSLLRLLRPALGQMPDPARFCQKPIRIVVKTISANDPDTGIQAAGIGTHLRPPLKAAPGLLSVSDQTCRGGLLEQLCVYSVPPAPLMPCGKAKALLRIPDALQRLIDFLLILLVQPVAGKPYPPFCQR